MSTISLSEYLRLRCVQIIVMEEDFLLLYEEMIRGSRNRWLLYTLRAHREAIRLRALSLRTVVRHLGGMEGPLDNPVSDGVRRVHKRWMALDPPPMIADIHNADTAAAVSGLVLPLYRGIVNLADMLNADEVLQTVRGMLREEELFLSSLQERLPILMREADDSINRAA